MNKKELTDAIAKDAKIAVKDAEKALNAFIKGVKKAVKKGEKVQLVGFGTFERRKTAARAGINPATKEKIKIPAGKKPAFKAGKVFKDEVNNK
ncbi:MAG: HU family DNA-binding protein [Clostridiales Family XIII bacterium]|jgi:DNA-binding protein HU-beta|nr:HU family DNA-binding protein [Clostridiales Family XIII bacterium]